MATDPVKPAVGRPVSAFTLRLGSHPAVYAVTLLLAVGAATFFLLVVPAVRALQTGGDASVADAKDRYQAAADRLAAQKKVIDAASGLTEEQRNLLAFAVPAEADTPGLSVLLHAIGGSVGARITNLDASGQTASGDTSDVPVALAPVELAVSADNVSYAQMKLLLAAIDNSLRLMDVRSMNFAPSSSSVSLQIRAYYLK